MRRYLLIVPLLVACARGETPPADSAAAAAPAMLSEADVAGTWSGNIMLEASDSVLATWTDMCSAGTCRFVSSTAPNDTVAYSYSLSGDSLMFSSAAPYRDTQAGAMVTNSGVARITANQLTGSGMVRLAEKPDSVVLRYRVTGTRQP
jgi:hypothetical protein